MDRKQAIGQLQFLKTLAPIVEAYAKGADVQYRFDDDPDTSRWYDHKNPTFRNTQGDTGRQISWRIKPEPVELTVWVCRNPHTQFDEESEAYEKQPGIVYKKGDVELEAPPAKYAAFWTKHLLKEQV